MTPLDRGHVRAIVWARGAGVTLAFGSSAGAVEEICQGTFSADLLAYLQRLSAE